MIINNVMPCIYRVKNKLGQIQNKKYLLYHQIKTREIENDRKREVCKLCPWSHEPAISSMGEITRKKHEHMHNENNKTNRCDS